MALRTSFKRLPLGVSSPLVARSLATSTAAAAVRPSAFAAARTAPRFFSTTKRVALEASAVVGDGGNTEPPEHGINVDKSMRMDALVFISPISLLEGGPRIYLAGHAGQRVAGTRVCQRRELTA